VSSLNPRDARGVGVKVPIDGCIRKVIEGTTHYNAKGAQARGERKVGKV
jgi:hypothetical protein